MLCGSENRTQATTGMGEFSCNGTILLSLYIQYAVLCQERFFFSCFRSCFSSLFCFCPVLHKVQVQFLETRNPSWQIGKLTLSFLTSQTLSDLWLVPSNLMKSCLKPSHLREKKEDWENHFIKEFYKLLTMHMRIFKKVKITWHCHMRQKNIMSQLTCPTALSLSSLVNIFSFIATCRKLK